MPKVQATLRPHMKQDNFFSVCGQSGGLPKVFVFNFINYQVPKGGSCSEPESESSSESGESDEEDKNQEENVKEKTVSREASAETNQEVGNDMSLDSQAP